jgi:hypothetical protein
MKQAKTTQARKASNPLSESPRRSSHASTPSPAVGQLAAIMNNSARVEEQARTFVSGGHLTQLSAAMVNGSPRVESLAQLRDDIRQSAPVQDLMGLASEVNQDSPAQHLREAGDAESGFNGLAQLQLDVEGTLAHSDRSGRSGNSMTEDTGGQSVEQSSCGCSANTKSSSESENLPSRKLPAQKKNATRGQAATPKPTQRKTEFAPAPPAQLGGMLSNSPRVLAQPKEDIQYSLQMRRAQDLLTLSAEINHLGQASGASAGEVVQCLMQGATFLGRYKHAGTANTRAQIGKLLTEYESAWGYGYGTYFPEHDGKKYRQQRLRILAAVERIIHEHFRDSGTKKIKDAPESALMLELLDEVQVEHEKQIGELLAYKDELPVSAEGLSDKDKKDVMKSWQSVVAGTGNLKIDEKEKNKGTGLERVHSGFRVKALSSIARLLQGKEGRNLIAEANQGGGGPAENITIAPVSNKPHDVMARGVWGRYKKGTIPAGGWDAEPLDQSKDALKATDLQIGGFVDLDSAADPLAAYEKAAKKHKAEGHPVGVSIQGTKYAFNQGTGAKVNYIVEHKDSGNRVMTKQGNAWREGLSPTSIALGHEIGHGIRNRLGASVSGQSQFLNLTGVAPEKQGFWSNNDEELLNITQVENKLLAEQGLHPRIFHKDYEESLQETATVRLLRYQKSGHVDQVKFGQINTAIQQKKFDLAGRLLRAEGF